MAGCSSNDETEVREYVATIKKDKSTLVEPLPPIKRIDPYRYTSKNLRSPFDLTAPTTTSLNISPELSELAAFEMLRPKEPLESFPLSSLKMVGTITQKGQRFGIIQASDGRIFIITIGNYIGQNFGRVEHISEDKIFLRELVSDTTLGIVEKETVIDLGTG
jgi:type IV pilus assembly protein PilP